MAQSPKNLIFVAGEVSGDMHAAQVIAQIKQASPSTTISAMGSAKMQAAGTEIFFESSKIAVTGFWEVIKHYATIRKAFYLTLKKIKEIKPDLIILDVMMDTATEGFQLSLTLRDRSPGSEYAAYRDIPILMLTAIHTTTPLRFAPDEDYLPVDAFLDKSADPDELLAKVDELLS